MLLFGKDYLERENDRQELLPPPLADTETDADQSPDDERKKWYQKTLCSNIPTPIHLYLYLYIHVTLPTYHRALLFA